MENIEARTEAAKRAEEYLKKKATGKKSNKRNDLSFGDMKACCPTEEGLYIGTPVNVSETEEQFKIRFHLQNEEYPDRTYAPVTLYLNKNYREEGIEELFLKTYDNPENLEDILNTSCRVFVERRVSSTSNRAYYTITYIESM